MRTSSRSVTRILNELAGGPGIQSRVFPQPASARSRFGLHELETIPERVVDVDAEIARERLVLRHRVPGRAQPLDQARQIAHQQAGMGLAGGVELAVDPQMDPEGAGLEPRAAPRGERGRLRDLRNAEQPIVEGARLRLAARR